MRLANVLVVTGCAAILCAAAAEGADRRRRSRHPQGKELKPGDMAPDFELVRLAEDSEGTDAKDAALKKDAPAAKTRKAPAAPEKVKLASFRGKSPVVLILSSYT
jgi:peroxiredoxin